MAVHGHPGMATRGQMAIPMAGYCSASAGVCQLQAILDIVLSATPDKKAKSCTGLYRRSFIIVMKN